MSVLQFLSFGITIARLLMAVFATFLIIRGGQNAACIILITLIVVFDILDGIVYRKSGKPDSKARRILDSTTDKASMFMIALATTYKARSWLIAIGIIMELWISAISIAAYKRGTLIKPSTSGKIGCVLFAVLCITTLSCRKIVAMLFFIAFLNTSIFAVAGYSKQLHEVQKRRQ